MVVARVSVPEPAFVRPPGLEPTVTELEPVSVAFRLMPNDVLSGTFVTVAPRGTPLPLTAMPTRMPPEPRVTPMA